MWNARQMYPWTKKVSVGLRGDNVYSYTEYHETDGQIHGIHIKPSYYLAVILISTCNIFKICNTNYSGAENQSEQQIHWYSADWFVHRLISIILWGFREKLVNVH